MPFGLTPKASLIRSKLSERSLVARRDSCAKDFETRLEAELPILYRVACRLTKRPPDAEDLVGQAILQALTYRGQFEGTFLRSWLIQILNRIHLRQVQRPAELLTPELEDVSLPGEDPWPALQAGIMTSQVVAELDKLPEEFRMAVALCDMEELSYKEGARALGVPIGTIRSRVSRGRRMLRQRLKHLLEDTSELASK